MPEEYLELVEALKGMRQDGESLPMAEDEWRTRPDAESYGIVSLDFEAGALHGDDRKVATAYEGSVDLYSADKHGAGWIEKIKGVLSEKCGGSWSLNSHQYERETGLFHWDRAFQVEE